jgi:hypothetical protein
MGTYWQNFIKKYKEQIPYTTLRITLEAFYHYCNGDEPKCSDLMGKL